ncbi:tyrosine-type recombinase/integrase [Sinorhizobium meliloti]|nr:tyrosine-type recombinase/integrase [Sinorhizobium meliloti]
MRLQSGDRHVHASDGGRSAARGSIGHRGRPGMQFPLSSFDGANGLAERTRHVSCAAEIKRMYSRTLVWTSYRQKNMAMGKRGVKTSKHLARLTLTAVYTGSRAEVVERASFIELPGRPWIDLENGIFFRAWKGRRVPNNKLADPVRIPEKLLSMMRRWAKETPNLVEHNGKVVKTRRGFHTLKKSVFTEERARVVNFHTLKHTCASWLMARGVPDEIVAHYISTTPEVVRKHYGHFAPDFHQEAVDAWQTKPKKRSDRKGAEAA